MKKSLLILLVIIAVAFSGCSFTSSKLQKSADEIENIPVFSEIDFSQDIYFIMDMKYELLKEFLDSESVLLYEKDNAERMCDDYYQLKNGVEIQIRNNVVTSVGAYYDGIETEHKPTLMGIDNSYDKNAVKATLGQPYSEDENSLVYNPRYETYIKYFFDADTQKVVYSSCFNNASV